MSRVFDDLVVALALLASTCYAVMSLGPKGLRTRIWGALAYGAERFPAGLRLQGLARRLRASADKTSGGACGGCESCGPSEQAPDSGAREVRIPLTKIGRRNPG